MTDPVQSDLQRLAEWLAQLERMTEATYGALDLPLAQLRPETLKMFQKRVEGELVALDKMLRQRSDADRAALVEPHLSALLAIKLFRDDLLYISLEVVRAQRKPQAETEKLQAALAKEYDLFLRNWVTASPLIHRETVKWFWPAVRNNKKNPGMRGFFEKLRTGQPKDLVAPFDLARGEIARESRQLATDPKTVAMSRRTLHLIGICFVLAQVEFAMRFSNDQSFQADVASWYDWAKKPAGIIGEMLGCLDQPIREAVRDGDPLLRDKLERARRGMLAALALGYSVPALDCATLAGFSKGADKPSEVVGVNTVTEKVSVRPGLVREDRPVGRDEMLGYMAFTGFPLVYPHREIRNPPGRPALRFGRVAKAVLFRAMREFVEHEGQAVFSVAETVAEQHELIADLMAPEPVRKAFAAALKRQPSLDLVNRTTRGRVLATAMQSLGAGLAPDQALATLIPLIQRYLTYFTRHTGDNIRDFGTPYLSSKWPTDLNGRQFFDCGVYAVETAFDLMRAANAVQGLTLEFRFLVFPEHVCLVVYEGQTSFAVNNARIYLPKPFPAGTIARPKDAAGFSWAAVAIDGAFSARFSIVLVGLHPRTLSSKQSEAAFKNAIWPMYQSILGLGVSIDVGKAYFDSSKAFDAGCALLTGYLLELKGAIGKPASEKELADSWTRATDLAEKLYLLAHAIAHPCNYVDSKNTGFIATIGTHVRDDSDLVVLAKLNGQLPMYEFVRLLRASGLKVSAAQQQLAQRSIGQKHVDELSDVLSQATCDTKTRQSLAGAHIALQGELAKLIKSAPPRILERIKNAGAALG